MLDLQINDFHLHLNGSFSVAFLQRTAIKNKATVHFDTLQQMLAAGRYLTKATTAEQEKKNLPDIWALFALVSHIMQTLEDIYLGTIDVIDNSKATYLEIRTTPKPMQNRSWQEYADHFVKGLIKANETHAGKKVARGLLSIDRARHNKEIAKKIIDRVAIESKISRMLVGVDVCGDPSARILTGNDFAEVLRHALAKDIGVAIHIGELDAEIERKEIDNVLQVIEEWQKKQDNTKRNSLHGKVRLGHAIFLTDDQCAKIRELGVPVEVCSSCHETMKWWDKNGPHPVTKIYPAWDTPAHVISGTDDELIFFKNAAEEHKKVLAILGYPEGMEEKADEQQAIYRFSN
jgi:adenosine deaminase